MTYKVFHTDVPLPKAMKQPDFSKLIPFAFDAMDAALERACALIKIGAVVWKIEGPHGVEMDRAQIEQACNPKPSFRIAEGPIVTSTGGTTQKEHRDRNVRLPRKPGSR